MRDAASGKWRRFDNPIETVVAHRVEEVVSALRRVEDACRVDARYAAGFVAYEAAAAFDAALVTKAADGFPLLCFGIYDAPDDLSVGDLDELHDSTGPAIDVKWEPAITREGYARAFERLQELIHAGDTYQVNFTYRLRTRFDGDPLALFLQLVATQAPPFGAYVDTGEWAICSASPELFFHRAEHHIESRPMKGTAPRGLWFEQDVQLGDRLRRSEKERAENVMIVDMVRNDLGRIARPGTVRVTNLFDVERHPSVLQLTSTVAADTDATLVDVMSALFPPASITGAPKPRTMEIIAESEDSPRRIYTGTIGFVEPSGRAQFNVAIRTVLVNRPTSQAEYGTGGGIVADSDVDLEFAESHLKSRVLTAARRDFELLETMRWIPADGFLLLSRHLERLLRSADYFGFRLDIGIVRETLEHLAKTLDRAPHRVRLRLSPQGDVRLSATPQNPDEGFSDVTLAAAAVDATNPFLYHKTTNRRVYQEALRARPGFQDVLLYNQNGEATESTIANLAVRLGGELLTPPISCGLLPGTLRAHLLASGEIRERVLTLDDVLDADALFLMNSTRGFCPVRLHRETSRPPQGEPAAYPGR